MRLSIGLLHCLLSEVLLSTRSMISISHLGEPITNIGSDYWLENGAEKFNKYFLLLSFLIFANLSSVEEELKSEVKSSL